MHSKPIVIPAPTAQDLDDGHSWYERQESGLGMQFLSDVNVTLKSIQRTPAGYQGVHQNYRKAVLKRFPYVILYREEVDQIFIAAVFHTSRSPESLQNRLHQ